MRLTALIGAFGLTAMFGAGAEAQSLACGGEYTIKKGDTLQQVTRMAYGEGLSWRFIYKANKAVVGPDPSQIEVGMKIKVPCRRGQTPGVAAQSATPAAPKAATAPAASSATATTAATTPTARSMPDMMRLVTATDYAPFHDQNAQKGGMITEIADASLASVLSEGDYRIDFINDWSAHIDPLLTDNAYDIGLSWFRPNCSVIEKLSADNRFRCENLVFSDPLFEQIIAYFARADDVSSLETHADIMGRVICRPAGYSTFMLEEFDLVEPNVTIKQPDGPGDCFEMLADGEVDLVVLASTVADNTIAGMEMTDRFQELPQLAYVATLHAITSAENPNREANISAINRGLQNVRESGAWFEIVQRHLIEHSKRTASN